MVVAMEALGMAMIAIEVAGVEDEGLETKMTMAKMEMEVIATKWNVNFATNLDMKVLILHHMIGISFMVAPATINLIQLPIWPHLLERLNCDMGTPATGNYYRYI